MELSVSERLRDRVNSGNTSAGDPSGRRVSTSGSALCSLVRPPPVARAQGAEARGRRRGLLRGLRERARAGGDVGEDHHLRRVRKLGQDAKRHGGATIVEVDEEVVGDNRHLSVSAEVLLERGDPQSQVELIAGALAHSFDRHLVAPTSSDQHQLAFSSYRVAIPSNERTVRSGNSSFARSMRGPAAAGPVRADVGDHGGAQRPEAGGRLDRLGDGVFVHAIGRHVDGAGAGLPGQRLAPFIDTSAITTLAPRGVHRPHGRNARFAGRSRRAASRGLAPRITLSTEVRKRVRLVGDAEPRTYPARRSRQEKAPRRGLSSAPTRALRRVFRAGSRGRSPRAALPCPRLSH